MDRSLIGLVCNQMLVGKTSAMQLWCHICAETQGGASTHPFQRGQKEKKKKS